MLDIFRRFGFGSGPMYYRQVGSRDTRVAKTKIPVNVLRELLLVPGEWNMTESYPRLDVLSLDHCLVLFGIRKKSDDRVLVIMSL